MLMCVASGELIFVLFYNVNDREPDDDLGN